MSLCQFCLLAGWHIFKTKLPQSKEILGFDSFIRPLVGIFSRGHVCKNFEVEVTDEITGGCSFDLGLFIGFGEILSARIRGVRRSLCQVVYYGALFL
jgi:hypothetical protein